MTQELYDKYMTEGKEHIEFPLYKIYPDGRCYSLKSNKFLKPIAIRSKKANKSYDYYDLRPNRSLVNRLVMFFYGDHNYENIADMPKIIHLDNNPDNYNITNLSFATAREINLMHNIKLNDEYLEYRRNKYNDTAKERYEIILAMRAEGLLNKQIADKLNVSEMTIYRTVNHYKKIQND